MKLAITGHGRLSNRSFPLLVWILLSGLYLVSPSVLRAAQNTGLFVRTPVKLDKPAAIRVNSDLVQIPVTVLDRYNHPVLGIEKKHFKVFEDRVEQSITHFAMEDAPISIGFVFDASASMRDKVEKSREAVTTFLNTANPSDEFFLVQFHDQVELAVDLTTSAREVQNQLSLIEPAGRTALLDAIYFSVQHMHIANNARKVLIIISDGGDNSSRYTMTDLKKLMSEEDVQIYAMGIFDPRSQTPDELAGPSLLRGLAKQSGGRLFGIDSTNQLPDIAFNIGEALRTMYVLGYSPKEMLHKGKYHRLEVKPAQPKDSPKLQASWRRGYYAPVE